MKAIKISILYGFSVKKFMVLLTCLLCYLYPKCMGSGIQAIDKTNELLSVMTLCINTSHNGAMTHTCYNFIKVLSTEFLWYVKFSWKQYFHALMEITIVVHKLSQLNKRRILGRLWLVFIRLEWG